MYFIYGVSIYLQDMPWILFVVASEEKAIKTKYAHPKLSVHQSAYVNFRKFAAESFPFPFCLFLVMFALEYLLNPDGVEGVSVATIAFESVSAFGNIGLSIGPL